MQLLFNEFLNSDYTLRVYDDGRLIFSSKKDRLLPLLEYIVHPAPGCRSVTIFDKIVGNAAALLSIKANCKEVFSPLGSQLAVQTLSRYGIRYHITKVIPRILKDDGSDTCPMEKLSIGKTPEEFYEAMKIVAKSGRPMVHREGGDNAATHQKYLC